MAHRKRRNTSETTRPRRDPLIGPGGKVDAAALHRAAKAIEPADPAPAPVELAHPLAVEPDAEPLDGDDDLPVLGEPPTFSAPGKQRIVFELQRDLDKRLDKYLVDRITFMSRAKLQELIDAGGVRVNDRKAKASTNLRQGDVVEVHIDAPESEEVPPQDIPLDVLFEDEHMIVLNKSPDIIVHPARSHLSGTMINALAYHFRHRSATGGQLSTVGREFARPGVVHRLDRQTSGVIVFAKTEQAHWKLGHQFEHRQTDKRYVALVHGRVEPVVDTIDAPIGPHPSRLKGHREKQVVRHDHLGKPALSIARVLGRYCVGHAHAGQATVPALRTPGPAPAPVAGWAVRAPGEPEPPAPGAVARDASDLPGPLMRADSPWISLVEVELKTGRTHQIRVHMQHRLYPLLADDMYDGRALPAQPAPTKSRARSAPPPCPGLARVALHAAMLKIRHPITEAPMVFKAPFPADLGALLRWARAAGSSAGLADEPATPPPGCVLSVRDLLGER